MNRTLQSALSLGALVALVVLGLIGIAQLQGIESRLVRIEARLDEPRSAASSTAPAVAVSSGWWEEDRIATADPANILKPHTSRLATDPGVVRGGTLRRQAGQDPQGLNNYIANGVDVQEFARLYSSRLAYRHVEDPDVYSPELAQKVTTPDGGLTYVVTLRKGVMWQTPAVDLTDPKHAWLKEPHELTSDDYAFLFEMVRNPQVAGRISSMRTYWESLDRVEVVDRYTFKLVFKEPQYTTLGNLLDLEPAPRWLWQYDEEGRKFDDATWGLKLNEHWYNNKAIGVGPYRFVSWEPGVKLEFERNPTFWGDPPSFDRVQVLVVKDQSAWVRKLKTGELDFTQIQPEQYRTEVRDAKGPLLGNERVKLASHPELGYFYIGWNQQKPYFADKRVRTAMTMAFDREGMVKNVFHGNGKVVSGPFVPSHKCYDQSVAPLPYDLKRAAELLEEAGWVDRDGDGVREKQIGKDTVKFEFALLTYGSSNEYETLASVYREALLSIGVRMSPQALEWSTLLKRMDEREFDAFTGAWVLDWPVDLSQIWHSREADRPQSSNRVGFRNKEADEIIEALRREFDEDKRTELCHRFHRLVAEEQPYTFFYQRVRPVLYWDWMRPLQFSPVVPFRDERYMAFGEQRP